MTLLDQAELRRRAQAAVRAPIPNVVRQGSANVAADYKHAAGICSTYLRRGTVQLQRVRTAVARLEAMQEGA